MPAAAVAGVAIAGSIYSSKKNAKAAENASEAQVQASQAGIDEQRRQFDKMVQLMSPYTTSGSAALARQKDFLGLNGPNQQKWFTSQVENSPYFQSVAKQGENAILQNASATGGLRGGNTQGALAQFRPQLLNQLVQQQYQNLGGIAQMGQAAAAGQASAGMNSANSISNLLGQQGQAQAGGIIGQANAQNSLVSNLIGLGGAAYGAGAF